MIYIEYKYNCIINIKKERICEEIFENLNEIQNFYLIRMCCAYI